MGRQSFEANLLSAVWLCSVCISWFQLVAWQLLDGLVYWLGLWPDNGLASCSARRGAFLINIGPQLNFVIAYARCPEHAKLLRHSRVFQPHDTCASRSNASFLPVCLDIDRSQSSYFLQFVCGRLSCIMMDSVPCGALLSCCTVASTMATDGGGHGQVRSGRRSPA